MGGNRGISLFFLIHYDTGRGRGGRRLIDCGMGAAEKAPSQNPGSRPAAFGRALCRRVILHTGNRLAGTALGISFLAAAFIGGERRVDGGSPRRRLASVRAPRTI